MADYKAITTEGWRVSLPFRVITSKALYDIEYTENWDKDIEAFTNEQNSILEKMGYEFSRDYLIRFGKDEYEITDIDSAIQMLALKDGCDLVEFENGNIGFVGYYHGFNENYFEVINTAHSSEHTEVWKNHIVAFEDDLCWLYIIENESEVESAVDLIEQAIDMWYNTEDYPEYEDSCIGDIIDDLLIDHQIKFTYKSI